MHSHRGGGPGLTGLPPHSRDNQVVSCCTIELSNAQNNSARFPTHMVSGPKTQIQNDIAVLDDVFKKFVEAATQWSELVASDLPFRNLLIELMNAVSREYHQLKVGAQKAPQLAAWAARNLLELKIITSYVLVSQRNAGRFIDDMFPDGIEFFEAVERLQSRNAVEAGITYDPGPVQQTLQNLRNENVNRGLPNSAKHLEMRAMALETGLSGEYKDMNRICSKLVHRTAFSVLAFGSVDEFQHFAPLMFHTGSRYALQIWETLTRHVAAHGMNPKP